MSIKVIHPGLLTTVQDQGRHGFQKYGVIVGGAMDSFAIRMANLLVGNEEGEAALEVTLRGPELQFQDDLLISICGGDLSPAINGVPVPGWRPVYVKKGGILRFGACVSGCRAYLAVAGGLDVPKVMESRSTYLRAKLGGFRGRALQKGDHLPVQPPPQAAEKIKARLFPADSQPFKAAGSFLSLEVLPAYRNHPVVRFIRGREFALFAKKSREAFTFSPYTVTPQSDRMGYRLKGPALSLTEPADLISEAVSAGTVQVPPDGNPIILMADRQTTGGYPKIAQVASVDLPVVAQVKPGETITFREISLDEAQMLYLEREAEIALMRKSISLYLK
ncbi:biotin-dependent carboxyltransferase family protein [Paenactinomyces guangxiensis]|uniref:Biotin-dependent carboxyltransferase n=1 Tax=Paenactinomyces guangxiensis TaxID=1490290 RepID=A0A7W2AAQ2_9BACL|nr:biotin-dependent carboxyltransferase family protein [Paenactinomyces guangxiensis]MBA4496128.1 biotin-dependent carboxyltransferase [Paenactinomyces guangxiensis]MBH8593216.1 biotin-dependent carboxyltransferase [Paenactinomyces guangxiensis]